MLGSHARAPAEYTHTDMTTVPKLQGTVVAELQEGWWRVGGMVPLGGSSVYQNVVVWHDIGECVGSIHLIGQNDLVLVVEGDIPLVLLVEDIRGFSGVPGLDGHILKHLQPPGSSYNTGKTNMGRAVCAFDASGQS